MRPHPAKRKAKVLALAADGATPTQIARRMRMKHGTVAKWIVEARRDGVPIPYHQKADAEDRAHRKVIGLRRDVSVAVEIEAEERGYKSVGRFINDILAVMAKEPNLIDAVLDDG